MEMTTQYNTFISSVLLLCKVMYWDIRNGNFLPKPLTFIHFFANLISSIWNQHWDSNMNPPKTEPYQSSISRRNDGINRDDHLSVGEIKMVMGRLGLECNEVIKGDDHDSLIGTEISSVFDHEEPSLDEIKAAFDVFDVNKDGYIDVVELHRILSNLGQGERAGLEECKKMICGFDLNGDGLIDFREFVRLMEKSFC